MFVESGTTAILIDAGFSGKEIASRLSAIGRDPASLDAVFVTHEHHDHICGVGVMSRRCSIPVYANEGTFKGAETRLKKLFKKCEFATGDTVRFKDMEIRSFGISHDTNDPVGFVISDGSSSMGCCTDTGIASRLIGQRLSGCDGLVLEFNHDPQMLKDGPYPPALKQRVKSSHGHLSNEDAAELLHNLLHDRLQHVVLAHLSETNNLPEIAYRKAADVLPENTDTRLLKISCQDIPTELLKI